MVTQSEGANAPDQIQTAGAEGSPEMGAPTPDKAGAKAFISWWQDTVLAGRKFHEPAYRIMYEDSKFIRSIQWDGQRDPMSAGEGNFNNLSTQEKYVVNVVQSEVQASVSTLYAKNPTFKVDRKPRMDFKLWDESPKSMQEAQQALVEALATGQPAPDAEALLQDINEGKMKRMVMDRVARTLELVFEQQLAQQQPDFKREMKQLIRRVETHGAGFMKLDYQRLDTMNPEDVSTMADITSRIGHIEALMSDARDDEARQHQKQLEELRIAMETIRDTKNVVEQEGLTVNFPRTPSVIIDPACSQLRGFVGAGWVAEEFYLSRTQIFQVYDIDVGSKAKSFDRGGSRNGFNQWHVRPKGADENSHTTDLFRVWEIYHKDTGSVFTIAEGHDEYLRAPKAPNVLLERFFPYYPLSFNDIEDERTIYPESSVRLLRNPQKEINRSKEALRQHRIASKPLYVTAEGALTGADMTNLAAHPAHGVVTVQGLQPGQNADTLLQQVKKHGIDQNVYETSSIFEDINRITRRSNAALGGASRASATADSIAEDSRQVEDRSKTDDIDDMLTEFAKDAGTTLLLQMNLQTAQEIAGPGAAWPEFKPEQMLNDIELKIVAGSSGRPNRALEVSTFQRLFPILVQTPGINPNWLAKTAINMADSNIDLTEAYLEGAPSIQAINAAAQAQIQAQAQGTPQTGTGNPATEPTAQGGEGANKVPRPPGQDQSLTVDRPDSTPVDNATPNSILQ